MTFAWPALLLLLAIPIALLAWDLTHRRRSAAAARPKILRAEAGARSLKLSEFGSASASTAGARPRVWLCTGLALATIAIARPQWGRLEEPVFDQSREILLAVDLSRSMLADDVKPSRLDRTKLLIQSLLEKLEGERVGLLVFAGTAFLQSPLSADYEILREFLPALGPDFLPEGGSNYGALLETAIQAFGATNSADRFLIILSDGEATDENWRSRITEVKNKNIRVIGLGVGTAGGALIPDGAGGLIKDDRGAVVLSKLESATLMELAQTTEGVYRDASAWVDLAALVNETIETGRKGEFVEKNTVRLVERFQWPLALGLWCLFVSFCYEFPVRPRPRDIRLTPPSPPSPPPTGGTAGKVTGATLTVWALLAAGVYPFSGFAAVPPATPAAPPAPAAEPSSLAKMVGRISALPKPTGRDWAELARETVNWGSRLLSAQQPVPEGPVRDALAATDLGAKLDPTTADWKQLREELEALLQKSEEQQEQQQKDEQQQQNEDQQKQDQQKSDSQNQEQNQSGEPQDQQNGEQKQDPSQQDQSPPDQQKPPGESAFGDMNQKEEPPPPEENTQKVGGAPERRDEPKEQSDPALALPLQKLDQLRNLDSPAELFQLMDGEKKAPKKTGKDW